MKFGGWYSEHLLCFVCGRDEDEVDEMYEDVRKHPWCGDCRDEVRELKGQTDRERYPGSGQILLDQEQMEEFL